MYSLLPVYSQNLLLQQSKDVKARYPYEMKWNIMDTEMQRQILDYSEDTTVIRYKEQAQRTNTYTSKD